MPIRRIIARWQVHPAAGILRALEARSESRHDLGAKLRIGGNKCLLGKHLLGARPSRSAPQDLLVLSLAVGRAGGGAERRREREKGGP